MANAWVLRAGSPHGELSRASLDSAPIQYRRSGTTRRLPSAQTLPAPLITLAHASPANPLRRHREVRWNAGSSHPRGFFPSLQ